MRQGAGHCAKGSKAIIQLGLDAAQGHDWRLAAIDRTGLSLALKQLEKLRAQFEAMRHKELVGGWVHAGETESAAIDRIVASGRVSDEERETVQLARWMTVEEAEKLSALDC